MSELTVVLLAAGEGTRMKSKTPKVLHPIAGRSLVGHVLAAIRDAGADRVVAVVGHGREQVGPHITGLMPEATIAIQEEQLGTGHAVRVAVEAAGVGSGTVLVAYADTPLLQGESLRAFAADHEGSGRAVSILTGVVRDPFGYGRVVRDADGDVIGIVEEKDATEEQRTVTEINSGILAFDAGFLTEVLPKIGNDNAKGEYYLTDTVALARAAGLSVGAYLLDDVLQAEGANDRAQLAALAKELNGRILARWMREGVTVVDPTTTWVDADVDLAPDVTILPGVQLLGTTMVGEDAVIGPDSTLKDCEIGAGAHVVRAHGELAVIGARASVGPFSYLRPGARLDADGKIGTFVEVKNSHIGAGAKVPHLSYVGDATIGEGTNIGAGTIFANYDGVTKHHTTVGRQVKSGSHVTFVAPVTIGDGASTGAGTLVRHDVPPGGLAVSSGPERIIEGWAQAKRAGTPQAAAAEAATSPQAAAGVRSTADEREASHTPPPGVGDAGASGSES